MKNIIIKLLILFFSSTLYADFIDDYYHGKYNEKNKLYALSGISVSETNYKEKAHSELRADIASQIYSRVSTLSKLQSSDVNGAYESSFNFKATSTTKDIPLYHISYIKQSIKGDMYYVLAVFDFSKSELTYITRSKELSRDIDRLYDAYKKEKKIYQKEKLLKQAIVAYNNLKKHQMVLSLFCANKKINNPSVLLSKLESELISLYDKSAQNIEDLAKIIVHRLEFSHINSALLVEPIMLRDGHMYSEFSYEFKDYFTNELKNHIHLSTNEEARYKAKGYYHLDGNSVIVNIFISDSSNNIVTSTIASMRIKSSSKLLKKYEPFRDKSDNSKILDEYLKGW